jgi:hypothetical protein
MQDCRHSENLFCSRVANFGSLCEPLFALSAKGAKADGKTDRLLKKQTFCINRESKKIFKMAAQMAAMAEKKAPRALQPYDPRIHAFKIRLFFEELPEDERPGARAQLAEIIERDISQVYRIETRLKTERSRVTISNLRPVAAFLSERLGRRISIDDLINE